MQDSASNRDHGLLDRLSADQVATLLGTSVADVRQRTREERLLAARFGSQADEPLYPAFQFSAELHEPVQRCMHLLGPVETYLYLTSVHPDMMGLTPLEVLLGRRTSDRALPVEAEQVFTMDAADRRRLVLDWAEVHQNEAAGW